MTTYGTIAKNSTSYATVNKSDLISNAGTPVGLLLVITNSGANTFTQYGSISKNQTIYSTINKN